MMKLFEYFFNIHFIKFIIIGIINTFSSAIFAILFNLYIDVGEFSGNISFFFGYLLSLVIAYTLNTTFNYKARFSAKKMITFFIMYVPGFFLQSIMILILNYFCGFKYEYVCFVSVIFSVPLNYILIHKNVFDK